MQLRKLHVLLHQPSWLAWPPQYGLAVSLSSARSTSLRSRSIEECTHAKSCVPRSCCGIHMTSMVCGLWPRLRSCDVGDRCWCWHGARGVGSPGKDSPMDSNPPPAFLLFFLRPSFLRPGCACVYARLAAFWPATSYSSPSPASFSPSDELIANVPTGAHALSFQRARAQHTTAASTRAPKSSVSKVNSRIRAQAHQSV